MLRQEVPCDRGAPLGRRLAYGRVPRWARCVMFAQPRSPAGIRDTPPLGLRSAYDRVPRWARRVSLAQPRRPAGPAARPRWGRARSCNHGAPLGPWLAPAGAAPARATAVPRWARGTPPLGPHSLARAAAAPRWARGTPPLGPHLPSRRRARSHDRGAPLGPRPRSPTHPGPSSTYYSPPYYSKTPVATCDEQLQPTTLPCTPTLVFCGMAVLPSTGQRPIRGHSWQRNIVTRITYSTYILPRVVLHGTSSRPPATRPRCSSIGHQGFAPF